MRRRFGFFTLFIGLLALIAGCARPETKCVSPEDNPQHHYLKGMELVEQMKLDDAAAKFDRALYCEQKYAPAHAGLAIVDSLRSKANKNDGYKQVDIKKTYEHLKLSAKLSRTPEDSFAYHVASIRVNTELKPNDEWLAAAELDYSAAMKLKTDDRKLLYYDGKEAATFFLGKAYLAAREFQKARDRFAEVLNARAEGKWNGPADKEWKRTDKIVRALAGITVGDVGKEIAVKDSVKRGDMAALLTDELKINKLFAGRIPVKSNVDKLKAEFTPADMLNNQFKEEVLTIMKWGIRGLEPVYDETTKAYLFRPDEPVTRKEFALVLEDVLIKLTGDEKIASAFFGHERSPFPDVATTSAWYNAIMNMTTRSVMETELSGEFRADDYVDGAEALLAIRVLRQKMNIY